jgi:hypothetical protein
MGRPRPMGWGFLISGSIYGTRQERIYGTGVDMRLREGVCEDRRQRQDNGDRTRARCNDQDVGAGAAAWVERPMAVRRLRSNRRSPGVGGRNSGADFGRDCGLWFRGESGPGMAESRVDAGEGDRDER